MHCEVETWRERCTAAGVDPDIVEHTANNFLNYQSYTQRNGNKPLPLIEWFRFYAQENAAELSAEKVKVDGCSVDESSVRPATADYKRAVFEQLAAYLQDVCDATGQCSSK